MNEAPERLLRGFLYVFVLTKKYNIYILFV